jgi:hypothetical protein
MNFGSSVVRVLPEEVRVRSAVGEGIGRGLRDIYAEQKAEPLPDHVRGLLLRVEQAPSHSRSAVLKRQREADEPISTEFGAPTRLPN